MEHTQKQKEEVNNICLTQDWKGISAGFYQPNKLICKNITFVKLLHYWAQPLKTFARLQSNAATEKCTI